MKNKFLILAIVTSLFSGIFVAFAIFFIASDYYTKNQIPTFSQNEIKQLLTLRAFIVQSGSMEPSIKTGGAVFTIPKQSYVQGDIITFRPDQNSKTLVTHRIELKKYPDGVNKDPVYLTSGDTNEEIDTWELVPSQIVGKVFLTLPYVGYAVDFAKKPQGFIFLIVVPVTILIYEEVKVILHELKKGSEKLKSKFKKYPDQVKIISTNEESLRLPKAAIIIPTIGAFFLVMAVTGSYFSDIEKSIGNVFQAADWSVQNFLLSDSLEVSVTPTPLPTETPSVIPSPLPTNINENLLESPLPSETPLI
jgi:signal peptidase